MLDINKLKHILNKWEKLESNNPSYQESSNAYISVIRLITLLEQEWEKDHKKDYICTCQTIRCDECLIRDK